MIKNIYLDYNSHTPCSLRVVQTMNDLWQQPGNPHSINHYFGWSKQQLIDDALKSFADIYDCVEEDLLFTSGATEANNLAICSGIALAKLTNPNADTILTSQLEHKSVLNPLVIAAAKHNLHLIYVKVTAEGIIDLEDLQIKLNNSNVLWVSCCMTNGVIGTNQPIKQLVEICQSYEAIVHVDASQAAYLDISCYDLDIDYLTLSAHKIYGPSGVGLLFSKHLNQARFLPIISGGSQQNGLRAGTLPVPLVIGFAEAAKELSENKDMEAKRIEELRDYLLSELRKVFSITVHGSLKNRHPGNLYLAIDGVNSIQLLNNVQPYLAFSLGSACDGMNLDYSPLMQAINVPRDKAEHSFRICIGRMTTKEEVGEAANIITVAAKKLISQLG